MSEEMFRRKVHFRWLSSVDDWKRASKDFKEKCFIRYEIQECFGCVLLDRENSQIQTVDSRESYKRNFILANLHTVGAKVITGRKVKRRS